MADNGNLASGCDTSDNDLFPSELVGYSTDIAVLIMAFLYVYWFWLGKKHPYCLARSLA